MRLLLTHWGPRGVASMLLWASLLGTAVTPSERVQTCAGKTPLSPVTYATTFGQQQQVAADSARWRIHLTEWQPSQWPPQQFTFDLKNERTSAVSQLRLPAWDSASEALQVNQIDEIDIFEDRLLILGRAAASSSEAVVVEVPSGKILDRFPCFMPLVSPDHRFVAFLKSFPGHAGPVSVNAEYLVYSLAQNSTYNRPHFEAGKTYDAGWAVYPPGATNASGENLVSGLDSPVHWISSGRLFWLDAKTLAFTDRYPGENRLVVVDLSSGLRSPLVRTEALNPSDLVDLEHCRNNYPAGDWKGVSSDPSGLIRVREITPIPGRPGYVCLRFDPNACLARTELTLSLR